MTVVHIPKTALILAEAWASLILNGAKTWELRSFSTHKRERIGLIGKGTGLILGTVEIANSLGPLSDTELEASERYHRASVELRHDHPTWRYAWVLRSPQLLPEPVPYDHPSGAQMFVTLNPLPQHRLARIIADKRFPAEAFERKIK